MNSLQSRLMFLKIMGLFGVDRVHITRCSDRSIWAIVGWPDEGQPHYSAEEEVQEVVWDFRSGSVPADASLVLDLIARDALLRGDRIKIARVDMTRRLMDAYSWSADRAGKALDALLEVRIDMIDEEEVTDAFFLHF